MEMSESNVVLSLIKTFVRRRQHGVGAAVDTGRAARGADSLGRGSSPVSQEHTPGVPSSCAVCQLSCLCLASN